MLIDRQPIEAMILRDESVEQALHDSELAVTCELST